MVKNSDATETSKSETGVLESGKEYPKYEFNMGIAIILVVFVFIIGLCFIAYFLTDANYKYVVDPLNDDEVQAKKYLEAITIISWVLVGFLILSFIIACFYFGYDFQNQVAKLENYKYGSTYQYIIFGGMCLVFFIIGILAILATVAIQNGPNAEENEFVSTVCAWIGGVSLAGIGAGVIFIIIKAIMDQKFRNNIKDKYTDIRNDPLRLGETKRRKI